MGVMEIILLIFGVIVFVGSFLIPAKAKDKAEGEEKISEELVREMVEKEVEDAKSRMNDIVDETVTYAMEKTERAMDRLTNEKMMAINEYSDTVLEEINKNHKEVVFLYDMLNDKHENLKSTVSEAVKTASQVKQTVQDAEITVKEVIGQADIQKPEIASPKPVNPEAGSLRAIQTEAESFRPISPERVEIQMPTEESLPLQKAQEQTAPAPKKAGKKPRAAAEKKTAAKPAAEADVPEVTVSLDTPGRGGSLNSNERILELHKAGKSNMAIAKELGLGIGEVKLVIDLFEGI